jgi:chromate transport protein ChrA
MKIGVKTVVLGVILALGYKNLKKDSIKNSVWATMLGLTVLNVLLAYTW